MSLLGRLAARGVARATGEAVQPVAETVPALLPAGEAIVPRRGIQPVAKPKAYAGAIKPSQPEIGADHLKSILDMKDKGVQESRVGVKGYTHVSTLTAGVCPRHYAINALFDKKEWEAITGAHRLMWAFGRTAEAHIRAHLTSGDTYGYQVYGSWRCPCDRTRHTGTKPRMDRRCPKCDLPLTVYHEQPWFDHDNKLVGNPDLGVFVGRFYAPIEIKSKSKDLYDKLTEPEAAHINQALLYRYLAKREGLLVHDKVLIVYAKKEFKWGSPYKIFEVDVTTPQYVAMLERSLELARSIRDAIASSTPAPRLPMCRALTDPTPKKCSAGVTCMNLPA